MTQGVKNSNQIKVIGDGEHLVVWNHIALHNHWYEK